MADISKRIHELGILAANNPLLIGKYKTEIFKVGNCDLLDSETKKRVVKQLKTALKDMEKQSKKVHYSRRLFWPDPFVFSEIKNTKWLTPERIADIYASKTGISLQAKKELLYIFRTEGIKLDADPKNIRIDSFDTDRLKAHSKRDREWYSKNDLIKSEFSLKRNGSFYFGEAQEIGISPDALLEIAISRLQHLTETTSKNILENLPKVLSAYETTYTGSLKTPITNPAITEPEKKIFDSRDKEHELQPECFELFEMAMKDKLMAYFKEKNITGISKDSSQLQLAFNIFMGVVSESQDNLSYDDMQIVKLVEKFAKDKTNSSIREAFVRSVVDAKIALGERDLKMNNTYSKIEKIKNERDYGAWAREYHEIKGDFEAYIRETDSVKKSYALDKIMTYVRSTDRKYVEDVLTKYHRSSRTEAAIQTTIDATIEQIDTPFGKIDVTKILGEKEVEKISSEHNLSKRYKTEDKFTAETFEKEKNKKEQEIADKIATKEAERDRERAEAKAKVFAGSIAAEQLDKDLIRAGLKEGISVEDYLEEKGEEISDVDESLREEEFNYVQTDEIQTASNEQVEENDFETTDEQEMELDA